MAMSKNTVRTRTKRMRRQMTAAGKSVRFSTADVLRSLTNGAAKRVDALAQAVGDDSRAAKRKLSVMLNRAKRAGYLKHQARERTWALTAKGKALIQRSA